MAREKKYPNQTTIKFKNDVDQRIIDFVNKQSNFSNTVLYFIEKEIAANGIRNLQEHIPLVRNILQPLEEEQQLKEEKQVQEEQQLKEEKQVQEEQQPKEEKQVQEEQQPKEEKQAQEEQQPKEEKQAQEEQQPKEEDQEEEIEIPSSYTDF